MSLGFSVRRALLQPWNHPLDHKLRSYSFLAVPWNRSQALRLAGLSLALSHSPGGLPKDFCAGLLETVVKTKASLSLELKQRLWC